MSQAYYYLVASLPRLEFESRPPLSLQDFLKECQGQISERDFQILQKAASAQSSKTRPKPSLLDSWFRFNQNLRNELAWARALRAGKDPLLHIRGSRAYEPLFIDVVAQAAKAPDPLASEKLLDRFRWQCLDGLLYGHYFDIEVLLVYAFKLQILERYQEIESSKGQEIFAEYKKLEMPDF